MTTTTTLRATALVCGVTMFVACGGTETIQPDDVATGKAASLSVEAANQTGALIAFVTDAIPNAQTGIEAAATASQLTGALQPAGCATAVTNGNQVTYTLASCSGPYGIVKMTGVVTVSFMISGVNALDIELAADNLVVGGATLTLSATATYQKGSTSDMLTVAASNQGTSARAGNVSHTGMYAIGWDATCLQLDGTFSTTIAGATLVDTLTWTTVVSGYERCGNSCPKAGGIVTVTGPSNRSVTVSYSGGGTASATSSTGQSGMIALPCAD